MNFVPKDGPITWPSGDSGMNTVTYINSKLTESELGTL